MTEEDDRSALTLTRRESEIIVLRTAEGDIEIKVISISGSRTKIRVLAPRSIIIFRGEHKQ